MKNPIDTLDYRDTNNVTKQPTFKQSQYWTRYWKNGRLHREDGPAIIFSDGYKINYIHGIKQE